MAAELPTLLLVHGFPLDGRMWKHQADDLADSFRVLAPDLPGHGVAGNGAAESSMDAIATAINTRLDDAGVNQVYLGGLSMGGYVALAFMRLFPERVLGLALIDTKATADTDAGRQGRDELAARIREGGARVAADAMLPKMFTDAVDPHRRDQAERSMLDQPPEALATDLVAMRDRPDSTPGLAAIKVPTVVVVGDQDPVTPPSDAEALAAGIPGARLVVVTGAAHLSPVEQPDQVNAAIRSLLG